MVTRSTRDEADPPASSDHVEVRLETSEVDGPSIEVDSSSHGVDDGFGLFVDLLLHEVVELTLHDLGEFDLEGFDGSDRGHAVVLAESVDVQL